MAKLKMAVIGLGMGASHGRRIIDSKDAELTAVCDLNAERVAKVFKSYTDEAGLPANKLPRHYTDMAAMFRKEKLDAVVVGLPTGLHHQGCIAAAEHGVNVLCDKPLDITTEKCDLIIDACDKHKVRLGVIYPMHFEPLMAGIKKAVDGGLLGDLITVDVNLKWFRSQEYYDKGGWRGTWAMDGGGSLMNQGAHPVDYMVWLCGEPAEITGDYGALNHKIETEDWAMGIIRFKSGVRGSILTTTNVLPNMNLIRVEVHGTKGSIMIERKKVNDKECPPINVSTVPDIEALGKRDHTYPVEQFIDAIIYNKPIEVTGEQARASVAIIEGVYRAANEGKRIKTGTGAKKPKPRKATKSQTTK
jgi:UDP-N-acetyl-2-amino-2-deoxyglucuronate dehydrogenase